LETRSTGSGFMPMTTAPKLSPPCFDGTTAFSTFQLQFETIAAKNMWNNGDKVVALIISLKGRAADILQTISEAERSNYDTIMNVLKRRFGCEH